MPGGVRGAGDGRRQRAVVRVLAAATFPVAVGWSAAQAQQPRLRAPAADDSWSRPGPLLVRGDVAVVAASGLLTGALMPFDARIARWMQRPARQHSRPLRRTAAAFRFLGSPGALLLGGATYSVGLLTHDRPTADVGLHATGAIVVGSGVGALVKVTLGRARPYAVADSDAHNVRVGRGVRGGRAYQSLPSGHATAAFALASVSAAEAAHRAPTRRARLLPSRTAPPRSSPPPGSTTTTTGRATWRSARASAPWPGA